MKYTIVYKDSLYNSREEAEEFTYDLEEGSYKIIPIEWEVKKTVVFTDGSCLSNPGGPSGWAYVTSDGRQNSGGEASSTNNRAELMAAVIALEDIPGPLIIHSDSAYLIRTMKGEWKKKKNLDLWERLDALVRNRDVEWVWVKGHAGNHYNEIADELAGKAARQF